MEDAIVFHRISKEIFLFAVFDGHGGVEVSQYCGNHIPMVLQSMESYKKGDYKTALEETFR
jgi:serine/threonine protein phosphatase PrpC